MLSTACRRPNLGATRAPSCRRAALGGRRLLPAHAAAPNKALRRSRGCVAVRALQSDKEEAPSGTDDFVALAKQLTGHLAAEFASDKSGVYKQLEAWMAGSHDEDEELAPRTDQTTCESDAGRLLRFAGEKFGVPTNISEVVHSVQTWLSNPAGGEEVHDSQMVARIVQRLLATYRKQAGEEFEGEEEHQWDRLYAIARSVLGSSVSRRVLKSLVKAYLGLP